VTPRRARPAGLAEERGVEGRILRVPSFCEAVVGELFDDTEPENDSLAEAMNDFDRIETFRLYVREGMEELQDWLREQPDD